MINLLKWLLPGLVLLCGIWQEALGNCTVFSNFTLVTPEGDNTRVVANASMTVDDDGRIRRIGGKEMAEDKRCTRVDLADTVVIPGFVSSHNHLWQSPFRGLAQDQTLRPWLKERSQIIVENQLEPGDFYYFTQHGALDLLKSGVTSVYNHSQVIEHLSTHDKNRISREQFAGQRDLPQKFVFGVNALHREFPDVKRDFDALKSRVGGSFLGRSLCDAIWLNFRVYRREDLSQRYMEWVQAEGIRIQEHMFEDASSAESENQSMVAFRKKYGDTFCWKSVVAAHFLHPNRRNLEALAKDGLAVSWNPLSNGRLGSGLLPYRRYVDEDHLEIGMGIDGQASSDTSSPFENMRHGLYATRALAKKASALAATAVLRAHTLGGAQVLGIADRVGSLEVGKDADFLTLRLPSPLVSDPAAATVLSAETRNIEAVYISGKVLIRQQQFVSQHLRDIEARVYSEVSLRARRHADAHHRLQRKSRLAYGTDQSVRQKS